MRTPREALPERAAGRAFLSVLPDAFSGALVEARGLVVVPLPLILRCVVPLKSVVEFAIVRLHAPGPRGLFGSHAPTPRPSQPMRSLAPREPAWATPLRPFLPS